MKKDNFIKSPVVKSVLVILLAIIAIICIVFFSNKAKKASSKANTFSTVIEETVENIIEISGTIDASQSQTLQAAGDGTVTAVYFSVGDSVKKGQTILELDSTEQEYELAKLEYNIAQTKISGSARDLELLIIQQNSLKKKLDNRKIIANFDGVLADFNVAVGNYLAAKDSVGTLIDRTYLKSYVEVAETDAPKLSAGQTVYCTFPAYGQKVVQGKVVAYPAVGKITDRGASIVKAEIRIENPPEIILPNYSFTGKIEISPTEVITLVEKEAVGNDNGKRFVEVIKNDGSKEKVFVEGDNYGSSHIKLKNSNLKAGDKLVLQEAKKASGSKPNGFKANANSDSASRSNQAEGPGAGNPPPR